MRCQGVGVTEILGGGRSRGSAYGCSDAGNCAYSQLLSELASNSGGVSTWFDRVSGDAGGSAAALASGDLDGRVSDQGDAHAEAVVATQGGDGSLQVHMLDDNVGVGQMVHTSPPVVPPSIGTSAAAPRSLVLAVGDFDSGGQNEIVVFSQAAAAPRPARRSAPSLYSDHPLHRGHSF